MEWPTPNIRLRAITDLQRYERNSRTHSAEQIEQLARSLDEFGLVGAIVINKGVIAKGHGTTDAIALLQSRGKNIYPAPGKTAGADPYPDGMVPVLDASGWSDEQFRAYVIADNRLALNAGWDKDLLGTELQALNADGFDLPLLGFSELELLPFLDSQQTGNTDPDDVPEPQAEVVAIIGDVWCLGKHRLACGDATAASDVERLLASVKPHLMVTDPPYGVNYDATWRDKFDQYNRAVGKVENDDRSDWREVWALFPGDVAYVWHAATKAHLVAETLVAVGFDIRAQIIWAKPHFAISRGHYHPQHEPCWYAVKGKGHWSGSRKESTIWQAANGTFQGGEAKPEDSKTGHSTQKPVEIMRRPIENNSSPGQAVYEPFCGSGTTIIAAEMTGRCCYAMEISPTYVDVAIRRWQEFTGEQATLEGDGRTFDQVMAERCPEANEIAS